MRGVSRRPCSWPRGTTIRGFPTPNRNRLSQRSGKTGSRPGICSRWTKVMASGKRPTGITSRQLTRESMAPEEIRLGHAWSPDGKTIAYYSNKAHYWSDDLWIVDVASGETRQLSHQVMGSGTPAWSPDGHHIAVFGIARD